MASTAASVLAAPPSAGAATQIGATFSDANAGCAANFTKFGATAPNNEYAAPTAGVLTSWSFQAGASVSPLRLKVGRPSGANSFTIVGEDALRTPTANMLNTYPVRIPVQAGDVIGQYNPAGSLDACARFPAPGYAWHFLSGDPPLGSTDTYTPQSVQMNLSATLEPDCDADGFGDETQDPELPLGEACGKGARTLTLDANKNKVKKGKRVRLSGQLDAPGNEAACESSLAVELQRKKPTQTGFTTLEQLGTDAGGNFSTKEQVKKTFEYRAQVPETATCNGQVSNSEKVKVKKRK